MISTARTRPYTPDEALEALGNPVSRNTWYKALKSGQVPHWKLGKRIFIAANVVKEMLVSGSREAGSAEHGLTEHTPPGKETG